MKHLLLKQQKAFTMLELVFAIVLIGILASLAMPRIDRDLVNEASTNILADIRYTQHLALMDNQHVFNDPHWQRKFWRIGFQQCNGGEGKIWFQTISSDSDMGGDIDAGEAALDPSNHLPMNITDATNDCTLPGINPRILITKRYGINNIVSTCTVPHQTPNLYVGFDYLGRPHTHFTESNQPNSASYIPNECQFRFTMSDGSDFNITITAETGYAFIVGQPDS